MDAMSLTSDEGSSSPMISRQGKIERDATWPKGSIVCQYYYFYFSPRRRKLIILSDEINQSINQNSAYSGLEWPIALVCFLHHRSFVGNTRVKYEAVVAEVRKDGRVKPPRSSVTFDYNPTSFHRSGNRV